MINTSRSKPSTILEEEEKRVDTDSGKHVVQNEACDVVPPLHQLCTEIFSEWVLVECQAGT